MVKPKNSTPKVNKTEKLNKTAPPALAPTKRSRRESNVSSNWAKFPRVVEDVVDEAVSRMNTRNAQQVEKCANVKSAIMAIILNGSAKKETADKHGVSLSTLGKYCRETRNKLTECLGSETEEPNDLLKQFDASTTTLGQLQAVLKLKNSSTATSALEGGGVSDVSAPSSHCSTAQAILSENNDANMDMDTSALVPDSSGPSSTTLKPRSRRSRRPPPKFADQPPIVSAAVPHHDSKEPSSSGSTSSTFVPAQNQSANENIPPSRPTGTELVLLLSERQKAQRLLTVPESERRTFTGTKKQFRELVLELLENRYDGNAEQLAHLVSTYHYYDYFLRRMANQLGIPSMLLGATRDLLNRYIDMDQLQFYDADEQLKTELDKSSR